MYQYIVPIHCTNTLYQHIVPIHCTNTLYQYIVPLYKRVLFFIGLIFLLNVSLKTVTPYPYTTLQRDNFGEIEPSRLEAENSEKEREK